MSTGKFNGMSSHHPRDDKSLRDALLQAERQIRRLTPAYSSGADMAVRFEQNA